MNNGVIARALANVRRAAPGGAVDSYVFDDSDPQFVLESSDGRLAWSESWHLLRYRIEPIDGTVVAPCLYPDFGDGYSEATRIDLPDPDPYGVVERLLVFHAPVKRLRFDPTASSGTFRLRDISFGPVSRFAAFHFLLRAVACTRPKDGFRRLWGDMWLAMRDGGVRLVGERLYARYLSRESAADIGYARWLERGASRSHGAIDGPRVSVVMPTCNTPVRFLDEAVESVRGQLYRNWELCIADDASDDPALIRALERHQASDPRIHVVRRSQRGGISRATNTALDLASGTYLAFLDHDDVLTPNALGAMVARMESDRADVGYSDHDHLSESGQRVDPFFKPDWSPDLFLTQMYLAHLVMFRATMVRDLGGLDPACDGAQDYDLVLRCWRGGARFTHVPEVLYHWRRHAGSTAANPASKPYAHVAGMKALQRHVVELYPGARVEDSPWLFCYDVRFSLPKPSPLVTIIIPTRDGVDLLDACLRSIVEKTGGVDYEVLIVDNGSTKPETADWFANAQRAHSWLRVLPMDVPFNWSVLNNRAAKHAKGQVLVFLNNDTEVISPDWLVRLAENALRPDIATCGALLLYPDDTIQHAGVVVGMGGWADHVFKAAPALHDQRLFVSPMLRRNVLAVTGACVAVAANRFRELGGFDESFQVCGSDVELGLRGHRLGLRNVYLPEVKLYHHESKTRDARLVPECDFARSAETYGEFRMGGDPFYSRNLDFAKSVPTLGDPS